MCGGGGGCYLAGYVWLSLWLMVEVDVGSDMYLFLLWTSGRWWWWWWWWLWYWLMVEVVMVGAVDVFLGSEIYYFIVVVILFYCDVYIILLC